MTSIGSSILTNSGDLFPIDHSNRLQMAKVKAPVSLQMESSICANLSKQRAPSLVPLRDTEKPRTLEGKKNEAEANRYERT